MKIKILKSASKDLEEGFYFYEFQYKELLFLKRNKKIV